MRLWMDVMRHLEPVMDDHERLFDAWEAGGVDGMVIGPLSFADKTYTFDPDPEVYARFGLQPPRPDGSSLWWPALRRRRGAGGRRRREAVLRAGRPPDPDPRSGESAGLAGVALLPALRGPPGPGADPGGRGDPHRVAARMVDAMEQYPMADGAVMDGPEWGYEIATFHQNRRSYIFHDLPPRWPRAPSAWATATPASSRRGTASTSACTASPTARCASGAVAPGASWAPSGCWGTTPAWRSGWPSGWTR